MKFKCLKIFFLIVSFIALERFCHQQTEGFRCNKIRSDLGFSPQWEVPSLSEQELSQVKAILAQHFSFLGSGGQCYTFLSEDGQYVLKVFKHHHMRVNSPLNRFSLPGSLDKYRLKLLGARDTPEKRLDNFFTSCKLAYENLKKETALLYLHLNKTSDLKQKLFLKDKLGIVHTFDLDSLEFVLQQKADLVYPKLRALIKTNQIESAKRHLDSLVQLLLHRYQKGIRDQDPAIKKNFGFIGEKAIGIDIGSYQKDPEIHLTYKKELLFEMMHLRRFLRRHQTELASHLDEQIFKALY